MESLLTSGGPLQSGGDSPAANSSFVQGLTGQCLLASRGSLHSQDSPAANSSFAQGVWQRPVRPMPGVDWMVTLDEGCQKRHREIVHQSTADLQGFIGHPPASPPLRHGFTEHSQKKPPQNSQEIHRRSAPWSRFCLDLLSRAWRRFRAGHGIASI